MYHLTKTKSGKFQVVLVGKNGEPLSTSELLNSKANCWKNIRAQLSVQFGSHLGSVFVQDDTTETPTMWVLYDKHKIKSSKTVPRYIPGKNPKKKK